MSQTIHIVPDPSRSGGARADAFLIIPAQTDVILQGFDLVGLTCYVVVTSQDGSLVLSTPALLSRYGSSAKATIDADDQLLRGWAEDHPDDAARISWFDTVDGWLNFADVRIVRMPELPDIGS